MKIEVDYGCVPTVTLIPDDRRDYEILHRLSETSKLRMRYLGIPGASLRIEPILVRKEDGTAQQGNSS